MTKPKRERSIMKELSISRLAAVDKPAQEGAKALLMKRAPLIKRYLLLSSVDGHSHLIDDAEQAGETSYARGPNEESGHAHPYARDTDGTLRIGEADGHTHAVMTKRDETETLIEDVEKQEGFVVQSLILSKKRFRSLAQARKWIADQEGDFHAKKVDETSTSYRFRQRPPGQFARIRTIRLSDGVSAVGGPLKKRLDKAAVGGGDHNGGEPMADKPTQGATGDEKRISELEAQLAKAQAYGKLNDQEKAYHDALDEKEREAFLKLSPEKRSETVEKAQAADPVVYTSDDGIEFRESDDPRYVAMAKRADKQAKKLAASEAARRHEEYAKRAATELAHLPGEEAVKVSVLRAVDGIHDQTERDAAKALLKAANESFSKAFASIGTAAAPKLDADSPEAQLDELAKRHANDRKVDYYKAYAEVCESAEGKVLYEKMVRGRNGN